jgi:NodT family efflux transporter outer membrane factor (OMF) lipoprotein
MRRILPLGVAGLAVLLSACTVGPDYSTPTAQLPTKWSATRIGPVGPPTDLGQWWRGFHDPVLDSLIARAITGNLDLQTAQARIREARASRIATASTLWPTVTGSASGTRFHGGSGAFGSGGLGGSSGLGATSSGLGTPSGGANSTSTVNLFQTDFDASWELDIFGGTRRSIESSTANLQATRQDRRSTLVSLLGEVVADYITLRDAQERIRIADDTLASERDTLALTLAKFKAGLASALDVAQAQSAAASTLAAIPGLRTTARETVHQLSVLIGTPPETLEPELDQPVPPPVMRTGTTLDPPAELLRRRPDIRAAERRVAAANADIGVAVANEYPSLNLTGTIGLNASRISQLGDISARTWWFGPSLSVPLFNAGKLAAQADVKRAQWDEAVITYRSTVLDALQEVENAITSYGNERGHNHALAQSVAADRDALTLSRDLYSKGLTSFLNVLDADRSLYDAQDQLAQSDAALSTDLISLFKALGGGWTPSKPTADDPHRVLEAASDRRHEGD